MIDKISELQKNGLSKKEIFLKLKQDDINDVFLTRELVRVADHDKKKEYYWVHNFYISIFLIKAFLLLFISHGLPWEASSFVFTFSDLIMLGVCYGFYLWKIWNQVFYFISAYLNIFIIGQLIVMKFDSRYLWYFLAFMILDGLANYYLSKKIYGKFWPIKMEKDLITGLYKF